MYSESYGNILTKERLYFANEVKLICVNNSTGRPGSADVVPTTLYLV